MNDPFLPLFTEPPFPVGCRIATRRMVELQRFEVVTGTRVEHGALYLDTDEYFPGDATPLPLTTPIERFAAYEVVA